jgi:hypothetical protein
MALPPELSASLASIATTFLCAVIRYIEKSIMHKREKALRDEIFFLRSKNGLHVEK